MNTESNDTREQLEFNKLRIETRKMMADMEHDADTRNHRQAEREDRETHYKAQQRYWIIIAIVASLGIILNAVAKILPSLNWFNGS